MSYVVYCSEIEYLSNTKHKEDDEKQVEENPYAQMNTKVESDIGQQINVEDSLPF